MSIAILLFQLLLLPGFQNTAVAAESLPELSFSRINVPVLLPKIPREPFLRHS